MCGAFALDLGFSSDRFDSINDFGGTQMRLYGSIIGLILVTFLSKNARCEDAAPEVSKWAKWKEYSYLDANLELGFSKPTTLENRPVPNLGQANLGLSFGGRLYSFIVLGGRIDAKGVFQFSSPVVGVGDFSGFRLNPISPFIGFLFDRFLLKFDYQLLGTYTFFAKTQSSANVMFSKPQGFRVGAFYEISPRYKVGGFYENITYNRQTVYTVHDISGGFKIWQAGLGLVFNPFEMSVWRIGDLQKK
jgi:hypothetical protein